VSIDERGRGAEGSNASVSIQACAEHFPGSRHYGSAAWNKIKVLGNTLRRFLQFPPASGYAVIDAADALGASPSHARSADTLNKGIG
jgi:hypothetical protein